MNSLIIALLGLYLLAVSAQGNGAKLLADVESEKQFVPWLVAMTALGGAYSWDKTRPIVAPFFLLLLLATALKPETTANIRSTYEYLTGVKK